jgi:hypothetical protein
MLQAGRTLTILLSLVLGLVLVLWTRRRFGTAGSLLALFLLCMDPNFIAHGHYVTTDLIATLTILLASLAWLAFLESERWRWLLGAGGGLGLALLSKFSTLFLWPVFVMLYLIRAWQQRASGRVAEPRTSLDAAHFVATFVMLAVISLGILGVGYWPATMRFLRGETPSHPYLTGFGVLLDHNTMREAYLLGKISRTGWWYYFPVVFGVKTPTATLGLLAVAAGIGVAAWWRLPPRNTLRGLRRISFQWLALALPPILYFVLSMASGVNIGVRHILPVYPFLFILLAAALCRQAQSSRPALVALLLAVPLQAFEAAWSHPHYLAFFNSISGGSRRGAHYLLDSNLDWGQELGHLKKHLDSMGRPERVCLQYFGRADTAHYGIRSRPVPFTDMQRERQELDCVVAISATSLHDVYLKQGSFSWLRELQPDAAVGYSIYVYDLRRDRSGRNAGANTPPAR